MLRKITIVHTDDWMGLYFDNKLVYQGHSLSNEGLLEKLNISYESKYADDDWMINRSDLPKKLTEVLFNE